MLRKNSQLVWPRSVQLEKLHQQKEASVHVEHEEALKEASGQDSEELEDLCNQEFATFLLMQVPPE